MPTVAILNPKRSEKARTKTLLPKNQTASQAKGKVCQFVEKEPDMMPGQWANPGNPTPYELRVTIHTCKRLWSMNKEALNHPDCDYHATQENIKMLERMYVMLMSYLEE